ncbi:hypothetical protein M5K25_014925 [Dendrobium thyrsiflorum]|uniref:Uncharacterized protein n=1 Tax=Dendrobium thyrsiflorum TaxID=117978 RepID=A0ABD0UPJ0_DENTH
MGALMAMGREHIKLFIRNERKEDGLTSPTNIKEGEKSDQTGQFLIRISWPTS